MRVAAVWGKVDCMPIETVEVLVVGAGQAGVAMSEHLSNCRTPHLVLERGRIAERWRSGRWDSLVANGPAWHDRFPGMEFSGDPDAFPGKEAVADYFAAYSKKFAAPIRCGVDVTAVRKNTARPGFTVETSGGVIEANYVVAATGPFQRPVIPTVVPADAGFTQMHSATYRNPGQLPEGAVLVVGAGSSGTQIANELLRAGRQAILSVGPHVRLPRRYRGRDYCWWLGVLGEWDLVTPPLGAEHVTIPVSGAYGGETIDFRKLAAQGMTLIGMSQAFKDGVLHVSADLATNIARGDASYLAMLDRADEYTSRNGLQLPLEPEARRVHPDPSCLSDPIRVLDLTRTGVTSIIWATGYDVDYGWLPAGALDDKGRPKHTRGIAAEPGIYFLGLPWLSRRGSSFIWGVWHDAKFIADQIAIQRGYLGHPLR
jgi:putative flavoprotein involved in K+ transport